MKQIFVSNAPRIARKLFRIGVTAIVLIVIAALAALAWSWYSNRSAAPHKLVKTPVAPIQSDPIKPPKLADDAPEAIVMQSVASPVARGQQVDIVIKTNPSSTCKADLAPGINLQSTQTLGQVQADLYGHVQFIWKTTSATQVTTWQLVVTCTYKNKSAVGKANISITP